MTIEEIRRKIKSNMHACVQRDVLLLWCDNGLRVSDVVNLHLATIINDSTWSIFQKKTKENKLIVVNNDLQLLIKAKKNNTLHQYTSNRQYWYRQFKKLGIEMIVKFSKNKAVTHAIRHAVAENAYAATNDLNVVKNILGHRSINSSTQYVSSTRRRYLFARSIINTPTGTSTPIKVNKKGVMTISD